MFEKHLWASDILRKDVGQLVENGLKKFNLKHIKKPHFF